MRAKDFLSSVQKPIMLPSAGPAECTPVEQHAEMLFKRDDLFQPFSDTPINGGKVRQAMSLIQSNLIMIRERHGGLVATCSSVHSPQGILVARIAKEFGIRSALGIGNAYRVAEVCKRHRNIAVAAALGCDVRVLSPIGYGTVLAARMRETWPGAFKIAFGMNFKNDRESILECVADQTANLPRVLDNLVVPVGSGLSAAGVLRGLAKYHIKVGTVHLIQISGLNKEKTIREALTSYGYDVGYPGFPSSGLEVTLGSAQVKQVDADIRMHISFEFPYAKWVNVKIDDGLSLDGRYEAKAYQFMMGRIKPKGKTLFWIVGNSSAYFGSGSTK